MPYLPIFFISTLAATLQASLGFGYGVIGMSLFPLVMPYVPSITLCTISAPLSNVIVVCRYFREIQWRKLWLPMFLSLIASTAISQVVVTQTEELLKQILGIFLILLALYFLLFKNRIKIKGTSVSGSICGILSGLGGGFFGVNGPPAVIYFMAAAQGDNRKYLATAQMFFFVLNVHITVIRILDGVVTKELLWMALVGILGVGVGTLLGLKIFKRLNMNALYYFVYLFMIGMGVFTFLTA